MPVQPSAGRAMIAVELLTAHPGNVRRDISLDPEFLASITELGILTPLRITTDGPGGYRVIEGHRRLAAAEQLGLTEVPYDLAAEREGDEAGQFLDMYATNHHRKDLTTLEEADALFAARMGGTARETAEAFGYAITLDQLALLAEFDGDENAVSRLTTAFCDGRSGEHVAERIRQQRAELAEHERLVEQLRGDGYTVTTEIPPGAFGLAVNRALGLSFNLFPGQDILRRVACRLRRGGGSCKWRRVVDIDVLDHLRDHQAALGGHAAVCDARQHAAMV